MAAKLSADLSGRLAMSLLANPATRALLAALFTSVGTARHRSNLPRNRASLMAAAIERRDGACYDDRGDIVEQIGRYCVFLIRNNTKGK